MKRNNRRLPDAILLLALVPFVLGQTGSQVAQTRHNLTTTGPGAVKVGGVADVCVFCHTPHASNPIAPLWNREDPGTWYQTYESSTMVAVVGQPTGSSRLCLSCHDGTIALTQTWNPNNASGGQTVYISAGDRGYIGTDLSDDHPISFVYDTSLATRRGELVDPSSLPVALPLDRNNQLQCTTCHDPHDDSFGQFLRMNNSQSAMCIACHQIDGWTTASHATSVASLASATRDDWDNLMHKTTVAEAACGSCHRPHTAGGRERLLRHEAEENNCLSCHDASVAQTDLTTLFTSISTHPVQNYTGIHDPTENPLTMSQHVECADCHNPHVSSTAPATAPSIKPSMVGVSGLSSSGAFVEQARYEYEVCYKCHSTQNFSAAVVDRVSGTNDISEEFDPSNPTYHPVEQIGRNTNVPSLLQPFNTTSMLYCTDCHGSDDAGGAQGPHGSMWRPLLVDSYTTTDPTVESPAAYALCYRCHNRSSILEDESFPKHHLHIADSNTACSVCHDPHGARSSPDATNLINFDRDVVTEAANGQGPEFHDTGSFQGNCTLMCHGVNHENTTY
jgi:predicted CXXCH cytochrome family protein